MADTQNGGVAFTTTHWSVVLAAQGPSPAAQAALDKLCRTYWRPIYGFVRRQGIEPEEAKDLAVRAFRFKKERGRLPSLTSQDAWERRMAEGAAAFVRYKDEGRYE